ncbi:MAG: IclR family transcriptional regulator [Candidatus Flemingiibacterium sp.]
MNNSAIRVLELLELFSEADEPLTVSDIVRKLGYPKTSVFDIVSILCERGFIRRENERAKTYVIGPKAYLVGMSYLRKNNLYTIAHPILEGLRDELGQTCYLAVADNGFVIYLDKVESSQPIRSTCTIGSKNPMYLTGLGKAMLAALPEEEVLRIAARGMEPHTDRTITTHEALLADLRETRRRGCAFDMGENHSYVRCTAAPVRDATGKVCAAISTAMLDADFTDSMRERSAKLVVSAAMKISRLLGFCKDKLYDEN